MNLHVLFYLLAAVTVTAAAPSPDFASEIRPIFNRKCTGCHGGVKTKGNISFLFRDAAVRKGKSGEIAIAPGHPEQSELIRRIDTTSPDDRMPPEGEPLTARERELLRNWIAAGAEWAPHWAYVPAKMPAIPAAQPAAWCRSDMDAFVLARLNQEKLVPSAEADRATYIRRASLDLTGLPPTPEETLAFLADRRPDAYEQLVDRLLASPRYGERWTGMWLDLARYSDTQGYEKDTGRTIWRYRDWLVNAYNQNMPFDQFTIEQLAGDLLPDATMEQKLATAFHRNTMTNTEGGTDDEEFRVAAVIDRVNSTWEVWMGTSIGCVQCHSHPYDPFTHDEYYRFFALLNSTADADRNDESPTIPCPTAEQQQRLAAIDAEIAKLKGVNRPNSAESQAGLKAWSSRLELAANRWQPATVQSAQSVNGARLDIKPEGRILAGGANPPEDTYIVKTIPGVRRITAIRLDALPDPSLPHNGPGRSDDGNFVLSGFSARIERPNQTPSPAGRYVRIDLAGSQKIISVAEVQVFSGEKNLAPAGKASQSSTDYGGNPAYAIDGNTVGTYNLQSVSHTAISTDPWWEVDLQSAQPIDRITVWNRTDGELQARLNGAVISILDASRKVVWTQSMPIAPPIYQDFHTNGPIRFPVKKIIADHQQKEFGVGFLLENPDPNKHGWAISPQIGTAHYAVFIPDAPIEVPTNGIVTITMNHAFHTDRWERFALGHFAISFSDDDAANDFYELPEAARQALTVKAAERTPAQITALQAAYAAQCTDQQPASAKIAALEKERKSMPIPRIPILQELPTPRKTVVFERGNWLAHGATVEPGVPASLVKPATEKMENRLDMARWMVQSDHPLTARVIVNRFWEQLFGRGIVETIEDFGTQGEPPTHPELLDYLAVRFSSVQGWDTKALLRDIVLSATYRQQSSAGAELLARDPNNLLLARGPRFRLSAEQVRDQALAAAGLLSSQMYGPGVMPPQPEGIWSTIYNSAKWTTSPGEDRYRRALYTYWKRTSPYPSMETFDTPSRVICTNRRVRTNTPLQAMVLLNDPVYVEAAQALGSRMVGAAAADEDRLQAGVLAVLARIPSKEELTILATTLQDFRAHFKDRPEEATNLAKAHDAGRNWPVKGSTPAEVAAWTMLGNILLNLDEAVTRL